MGVCSSCNQETQSKTQDTDASKKGKPSDSELDELAGKIGAVWKRLGIRLGISQDVLEGIAANAEDKPFQMLLLWRNTTTSATPYCDLYNALCHDRVGLNNVAKEFCYTSTEEESSHSCSKRELPCSSDHADAKQSGIAAQTAEQDVKGTHKEQELDQYEDHSTWLEMVKQDYVSFLDLLYSEEQTDQQRKRINLFVARFQHQFPSGSTCDGCDVELSDRQYRCLNCIDVVFCYDCYMKRVKPEGHTENHEVIETRFKCGGCKGFILGTRFCCYECPDFFLCFQCQSRHPAAHKVTKFPVKKEPFVEECQKQLHSHYNTFSKVKIIPWERTSAIHIDEMYTKLSWVRDDRKPSGVTQEKLEDYTDIFKGDMHHPKPKRLLVYGRPGIGKSTFSQKNCFRLV